MLSIANAVLWATSTHDPLVCYLDARAVFDIHNGDRPLPGSCAHLVSAQTGANCRRPWPDLQPSSTSPFLDPLNPVRLVLWLRCWRRNLAAGCKPQAQQSITQNCIQLDHSLTLLIKRFFTVCVRHRRLQPQTHARRLHGFVHHVEQFARQLVEFHFVAHRHTKRSEGLGRVVLRR